MEESAARCGSVETAAEGERQGAQQQVAELETALADTKSDLEALKGSAGSSSEQLGEVQQQLEAARAALAEEKRAREETTAKALKLKEKYKQTAESFKQLKSDAAASQKSMEGKQAFATPLHTTRLI